ncbi:MAG: hypothetical protein EBW65_05440, partial [Gammaproteobacteria bacterium]|nr:hypothetical protein [Gammaproteobacteria bacterium]
AQTQDLLGDGLEDHWLPLVDVSVEANDLPIHPQEDLGSGHIHKFGERPGLFQKGLLYHWITIQ